MRLVRGAHGERTQVRPEVWTEVRGPERHTAMASDQRGLSRGVA